MSEYITPKTEIKEEQSPTTAVRYDYSPGYDISVKSNRVPEGASITFTPLTAGMSTFTGLNVDLNSETEVVWLYNKYKEVWELEKGQSTPFVYNLENANDLVAAIKIYLYFNSLEGSNVIWDETTQEYKVEPKFVEQRRIEDNNYIDPAHSEYDRLPPLEPANLSVYRNSNGYLITNPQDPESFLVKWDLSDADETLDTYYKYQGFWFRAHPTEDFVYSLENAQRLESAINKRIYPYTPNTPESWKTLREAIMQKFGTGHHWLTSGVVAAERLDMPEGVAIRKGPTYGLAADGETLTGLYDFGSPYATGKNRF